MKENLSNRVTRLLNGGFHAIIQAVEKTVPGETLITETTCSTEETKQEESTPLN